MSNVSRSELGMAIVRMAELEAALTGVPIARRRHETKALQGMRAEREALVRKERIWFGGGKRERPGTTGRMVVLWSAIACAGALLLAFLFGGLVVRISTAVLAGFAFVCVLLVRAVIVAIQRNVTRTAREELDRRIALEEATLDAETYIENRGARLPQTLEEAFARIDQLTALVEGTANRGPLPGDALR